MVTIWTNIEGLKISPNKTSIVGFTRRKDFEGLGSLKMREGEVTILSEVKCLDVITDFDTTLEKYYHKSGEVSTDN